MIPPQSYVILWATGDSGAASSPLQVPFKLSAKGETLTLSHRSGALVDSVDFPALDPDVTYGRRLINPDVWVEFQVPTIGAPNDQVERVIPNEPPLISQDAGLFDEPFFLTLSARGEGAEIRYTLDGSEPLESSPLYTEPLWIDSRQGEANTISLNPTNNPQNEGDWFKWRAPRSEILKVITLKTRTFGGGGSPSPVLTRTFLNGEELRGRYDLPILSLTMDPDHLFDYYGGIYVPGYLFDKASSEGYSGIDSMHPANYHVHGYESERPAHLEFFTPQGGLEFSKGVGVRVNGNTSRSYPAKSLRVYMRDEYGDDELDYPLFPGEEGQLFERFIIRNGSQQFHKTLLKDGVSHTLAKGIDDPRVDSMAFRSCILFVNGAFWGIHNLRERLDDHYLSVRYDVDRDDIVIGELNGGIYYGEEGDEDLYWSLAAYINNEDLSEPTHYAHVQTLMDTDNYIDYMAIEIFVQNTDWPNNNYRYWRKRLDSYDPSAGVLDGRYRWFISDADTTWANPAFDALKRVLDPNELPDYAAWASSFFNGLLENPSFKRDFINRFADLLNTRFRPEEALEVIDGLAGNMDSAMEEHINRWTYPKSKAFWMDNVELVREFARNRATYQRQHIVENFGLDGVATLRLGVASLETGRLTKGDVSSPGSRGGTLEVNTLKGLSAGWEGIYFQGIPVTIRAVADPGYRFVGWVGSDETSPSITLRMGEDTEVTAIFEAD